MKEIIRGNYIMRFREINENREIREEIKRKQDEEIRKNGYGKIKPEGTITVSEAKDFINDLFGF
jgi:hypothetical protein